jgi:FkbM family methyltransferase
MKEQALLALLIQRKRRSAIVRCLASVAQKLLSLYENHDYDPSRNGEYGLLRRLSAARPATIFDVGANVGDWTVFAAKLYPDAFIHALEIAAPNARKLEARLRQEELLSRVRVNRFGLGASAGRSLVYYYPSHPDLTCDRHRFPEYEMEVLEAEVRTGDQYLRDLDIQRVDFLKIDVEGQECAVLQGFGQALEKGIIQVVQFEFGPFSVDTRILLRDYYELLGKSYWIGKIYPDYVDFRDWDWRHKDFRPANYLAVSRSRPELREALQ